LQSAKDVVMRTTTTTATPAPAATEYLTTVEAAAYLKMSRQSLEAARYRADGSGPAYIKLERAVGYRRSALDAWMTAHDHAPDKPLQKGA
jgi:predicted DNA-binding transcriptional regulator AlpA